MGGSNRHVADTDGAAGVDSDSGTVADLRERLDVLTAFAGGIVFEIDREGRYLGVWTGEPQLLVRPANELIGRTVAEVAGPAIAEQYSDLFRSVVDTGKEAAFEYTLDVPAGRRTFSCSARPHDPRGGGARTVTVLVRDITDAKTLEAKLVQAERLAALGLLAASVGHEIRQPLAFVLTSLEVLERELGSAAPPPASAALRDIRGGARRIAEIAAGLALLAGQRRASAELDVRRPVQAAIDLCASELSRVKVEKALADVPNVLGDEGELCQVFANLILNAVQALASRVDATGAIRLTASVAPDGASVRVAVIDDGPGIDPGNLAHVFDPFFTTKAHLGGTGLGLFIARNIVEAHGGTLEVTSELGRGTTFEVSLPRARVSALPVAVRERSLLLSDAPKAVRSMVVPSKPVAAARRTLEVLVVDDEPRFLASLRVALEGTHRVKTCAKAAEALALLMEDPRRFDVVLCDLAMPGMDGVAFYAHMDALGVGDRFVLMTGGAVTARAAEFVRSRACPNIGKPFELEGLLSLLDRVTQRPVVP